MNALLNALDVPGSVDGRHADWEAAVARSLEEYAAAPRPEKRATRKGMTRDRSDALVGWSMSMTTAAVRRAQPRLVVLGLLGLSLLEDVDERDALVVVALLRRSATLAGGDARAAFDEAAALADRKGRAWLESLRESAVGPAEMLYEEHGEGETFEWRRSEPSWDPLETLAKHLPQLRERLDRGER